MKCLISLTIYALFSSLYMIHGKSYRTGDKLWYNKITSERTQLPFAYEDLPFVCQPTVHEHSTLNLGQVLQGDRILLSDYDLVFAKNVTCNVLCTHKLTEEAVETAIDLIKDGYRTEWIVDELAATSVISDDTNGHVYDPGFPLGFYDRSEKHAVLFNHVFIKLMYAKSLLNTDTFDIVGFEVLPASFDSPKDHCVNNVFEHQPMLKLDDDMESITYSYSVHWIEDSQGLWDKQRQAYMDSNLDTSAHWYSLMNSLVLLLLLTIIVAVIMLRTLHRDISAYNKVDMLEAQADDVVGWKLVHGDVFRTPRRLHLLTPILGVGIQLLSAAMLTISFAALGLFEPKKDGSLANWAIFSFVFSGAFAGYFSARIYKAFDGYSWKKNAFWTASVFPMFLFLCLSFLNTFSWSLRSSFALPLGTFLALLALWLFVCMPCVYIGAYFGQKKQAIEHPVRTAQIPRQVPHQTMLYRAVPSIFLSGLMPFAVIFMELFFVMKSIWQDEEYYMYGFLAVMSILLVMACIEVTIVLIYFQLCNENYHWQWRSFMVASSSAWYIFLFAISYYVTYEDIIGSPTSAVFFFTYTLIGLVAYVACTGAIGFFATYLFLRVIYRAVKID